MSFQILIADDSEIIRAVLKRTLEMAKVPLASLDLVQNGAEALKVIQSKKIDVLFTDINMPEMNGVKLVEELKGSEAFKDIPIVVISTEGSEQRISFLKEMGITNYLRKPFTPESIRKSLAGVLGDWGNE